MATTKIRNNYVTIQSFIFAIAILDFSPLPLVKLSLLILFASFLMALSLKLSLFQLSLFFALKGDNYMGSNTEKKPWTNLQNPYRNWSKEIKSDNFCYRKVGRAITKSGAIEKSSILLSQYWIKEEFVPISHFNRRVNKNKSCQDFVLFCSGHHGNKSYIDSVPILLLYSRRKYYCYHQNTKWFLVLFKVVIFLNIGLFSFASNLVIALNVFTSIFVWVLKISSWFLFCIASHIVLALSTIVTAIVVALLRSYFRKRVIKRDEKRIKSDYKEQFLDGIVSHFYGSNNIFADCTKQS